MNSGMLRRRFDGVQRVPLRERLALPLLLLALALAEGAIWLYVWALHQ